MATKVKTHSVNKNKQKDNLDLDPDCLLLLENQLCFKIYSLSHYITKKYYPHLKELGLTYPQYLVLLCLWEYKSLTISEIGNKLHLDSGTLTPLLKKLEKQNIVSRTRQVGIDDRVINITLTKDGKDLKNRALQVPNKMFCDLNIQKTDLKNLFKILKLIEKNIFS